LYFSPQQNSLASTKLLSNKNNTKMTTPNGNNQTTIPPQQQQQQQVVAAIPMQVVPASSQQQQQQILQTIDLYNLANYNFGAKEPQLEKDRSVPERLQRMKENYEKEGMRRSVDAVLLVHLHNHPHVLLLQLGNHQKGFFKLPGGTCRPDENEVQCLERKLVKRLAPKGINPKWQIGDCISTWYRPNFDTLMVLI